MIQSGNMPAISEEYFKSQLQDLNKANEFFVKKIARIEVSKLVFYEMC
jgi:hypothetical protein